MVRASWWENFRAHIAAFVYNDVDFVKWLDRNNLTVDWNFVLCRKPEHKPETVSGSESQ